MRKFEALCKKNHLLFTPIVFETLGHIQQDGLKVLNTISSRRAVREGIRESLGRSELISRLSIILQRNNFDVHVSEREYVPISDPAERVDVFF